MNARPTIVNDSAEAIRHTTDQFARLRAAFDGGQHYSIATDHPRNCHVPLTLSRIANALVMSGTDPASVVLISTDFLLDSGHKFALTVIAFPKASVSVEAVANLAAQLTGQDEAAMLTRL